jgi:uncharacterized protein YuzB (UPF0349 family)
MEKVYFCRKNDFETKALHKFLKTIFNHVKIKRKDCLGKCKTCKRCPFAVLDGEVVKTQQIDELYSEINSRLTEEWKQYRKKSS